MKRLILVVFLFFASFYCVSSANSVSRPNIIFILTDDMPKGMEAQMPNVQKLLANHGASFENFFVTTSLCCPSRATILRGQYVHNHGIWSNVPSESGGFPVFHEKGHESSTVAVWLKNAGYRTALFGKYLNQYPGKSVKETYLPPGWDEWNALMFSQAYYSYWLNENGKKVFYGNQPEDYLTDVISKKATDFLRGQDGEKPFFMYISVAAPHGPSTPAVRHRNAYQGEKYPKKESFNISSPHKPKWVSAMDKFTPAKIDEVDAVYRKRLQSLLAVDEMVAVIVEILKKNGQLNNTYIFFTSDNGYHMGEHRLQSGKNTAYEEDVHVPMIVRGPGIKNRIFLRQLGANIDFAATFADIAGISPPDFVDGRSLMQLLYGRNSDWRKSILTEHREMYFHEKRPYIGWFVKYRELPVPKNSGLRTEDYYYVEYENGEREFYDMKNDPAQLKNKYRELPDASKNELEKYLGELRRCKGAECKTSENKEIPKP